MPIEAKCVGSKEVAGNLGVQSGPWNHQLPM